MKAVSWVSCLFPSHSFTMSNRDNPAPTMFVDRVKISAWLRIGIKRPIPAMAKRILITGPSFLNK